MSRTDMRRTSVLGCHEVTAAPSPVSRMMRRRRHLSSAWRARVEQLLEHALLPTGSSNIHDVEKTLQTSVRLELSITIFAECGAQRTGILRACRAAPRLR